MKFHFGNHPSHHGDRGGGGGVGVVVTPAASAWTGGDAMSTAALCGGGSGVTISSTKVEEELAWDSHGHRPGGSANGASEVVPDCRRSSKSRQFFRIKGRRNRSASPVPSSNGSDGIPPDDSPSNPQEGQQNQHRFSLLRPRMRRTLSLPHAPSSDKTSPSTHTATCSSSSRHSSPPTISNNTTRNHKRSVTFTHLQIREYNTILGDHPCCPSGPPLSLGWEYNKNEEVIIGIDDYENSFDNTAALSNDDHVDEQQQQQQQLRIRRSKEELRLNSEDRREILYGLMKPTTSPSTSTISTATMTSCPAEDDENEKKQSPPPQADSLMQTTTLTSTLFHHSTTSFHSTSLTNISTTACNNINIAATTATLPSSSSCTPLYTKEELRKAERKLDRERRCASAGNAARTRRRLKRGFFMPLTPEEEELIGVRGGDGDVRVVSGDRLGSSMMDNDNMEHDSSSSDEDDDGENDDGVVQMDISPEKKIFVGRTCEEEESSTMNVENKIE